LSKELSKVTFRLLKFFSSLYKTRKYRFVTALDMLSVCSTAHLSWVHWHCWLSIRKSIWSVKNWVMRCWGGYLSGLEWGGNYLLVFQLTPLPRRHLLLH